jgi:hypothetical protein
MNAYKCRTLTAECMTLGIYHVLYGMAVTIYTLNLTVRVCSTASYQE